MSDLAMALALVLVIEGLFYATIPGQVKRMMASVLPVPDGTLRLGGLLAIVLGLMLVFALRG
ncbi:MAG: DUF2065 domain-containing protein [Inquilinus sp.]|nr:DUF2065 domain-containing protein [Inquilinus sp.]